MNRRRALESAALSFTTAVAGCLESLEANLETENDSTSNESALNDSDQVETPSNHVIRKNSPDEIFQTGRVASSPDSIHAGQTISVTGEVSAEIPAARDNITYAAVGTPSGDLYGLTRMSGSGSGTVTVSASVPSTAAEKRLIWTFIPALSERGARSQFHEEANSGRYKSGDLALVLGTIAKGETSENTDEISRKNHSDEIFQTGRVASSPDSIHTGQTISVTGEVSTEIPDARDNITYAAVGTPSGDLYGLTRMSGSGSGTVTVSASIPSTATEKQLIWTFIPAVSETEARDQFHEEASSGRYRSGDLALVLGTIAKGETSENTDEISRKNNSDEIFQTGRVTSSPDSVHAGQTISVTGEVSTEIPDAQDNITYAAVGTPSGDLYGLAQMSGSGSGTVTVSASIPSTATEKRLIWTFIPALSERGARSQFHEEASSGRYKSGDLALVLGTIAKGETSENTDEISRKNNSDEIFQTGRVTSSPDSIYASQTISVTGEVSTEIPDAQDNITYAAVGTPSGDLYGLTRMSGSGSGTVTVSASIPSTATEKQLIWTFIPAVSETGARDQFRREASNNRYQSGELSIVLGTIL